MSLTPEEINELLAKTRDQKFRKQSQAVIDSISHRSSLYKGRTKETHAHIDNMAQKLQGRTKETNESVAAQAQKMLGRTKETNEGVAKMANTKKDRTKETHEYVANQAKVLSGRTKETHSYLIEAGKNISKALKGKPAHNKGKSMKLVICPHCNKEGGAPVMGRYHMDNCKQKA
jgi:predicted phage tail protein